ncbi:MAG: hypothetical protein U0X75_16190 [Acidobacteriota bacterium]
MKPRVFIGSSSEQVELRASDRLGCPQTLQATCCGRNDCDGCRHTKKLWNVTIAMAVALQAFGRRVAFYTLPDPAPQLIEKRCYRLAEKAGIPVNNAICIKSLCALIRDGSLPIVFYDTVGGVGHFSPMLGLRGDKLLLPFDEYKEVAISRLQ